MIHTKGSSTDVQRIDHQVRIINKKNFCTVALIAFVSPFLHLLVRCRTALRTIELRLKFGVYPFHTPRGFK